MTYYVQTDVKLKLGALPAYAEMMGQLVPYMARHGWKLVLGLQPYVADFTEVLHVWEVQQFADIERALNACRVDPEAHAILTPMPALLQTEVLKILTKTDYSG